MNDFLQMLWTQTWQIAVLAVTVALCTRTVARNRPHLAHALWLLVLIKCVIPPMWGHSLGVFSQLQKLTAWDEKNSDSASAEISSLQADSILMPSFIDAPETKSHPGTDFAVPPSTQPVARHKDSAITHVTATPAPEVPKLKAVEAVRPDRDLWPGLLLSSLAIGASATLSLMIIRCLSCLRHIHRHRTTAFDDPMNQRLQMLSKKLRLRRVPRIIVSDVLFGPAVLGVLRHTIVLPRCLLQTSRSFLPERTFAAGEPARRAIENAGLPEGLECTQVAASREVLPGRQDLPKPLPGRQDLQYLDPILAHELLHIRRGDLRTGLLQAIVQSLWWFHPAVWFCNRWLSREAERCCDEQVIAELGCSPAQYARSLLSVIESKHALQPIPVFPGMKPVEITTQRMERIMSLKTGLKKQTPLWCWLAVAGLAIVVLPGAVAKPVLDEPKSARDEKQPTTNKTVGESADAIRLNGEFDLTGDLKPETVVAFVNDKPVKVSDVVQVPFVAGGQLYRSGDSPPTQIRTEQIQQTLRKKLPEFLYDELIVQHYSVTVSNEQQANALKSLEEEFRHILESMKAREKLTTDEQLEVRLAENDMSIEKLRQSYVRVSIAFEHAQTLPADSLLRDKEGIIKTCRSLIDDCHDCLEWEGAAISEPMLVDGDGEVNSIVPALPVPTAIAEATDPLLKLVWEARESSRRRPLSTVQHTPWQIMHAVQGLRQDTLVKDFDFDDVVNALVWIQSGWSSRGENWFQKTEYGGQAHPFSKPYVFEGHINQFAAILASCRLSPDTMFETADGSISMLDIISNAKMTANDREEVTWTLLTLCRYLPPDARWANAKGEEWSIERLVEVEVGKTVGGPTSPCGGTCGLYALAVARNEYLRTGKPLEGVWLKADKKINRHIDLAKLQQNPDGSLSSDFFRSGKRHENFDRQLASSGHILQFLMQAVSDEDLKEDWIRRAVEATANDIQMHQKEFVSCDPLFTAIEALTTYLERVTKTSIGCARRLPMEENSSSAGLNPLAEGRRELPDASGEISGDDRPIVLTYNVSDLVAPVGGADAKMDFSPLVELIKTSIEPESWETGRGTISPHLETISLVIRQTQDAHDGIQKILSQLRKSYDSVKISCRLMKLTADSHLKGLEQRCSLHALHGGQRWALLTKSRSEELQRFLMDEKVALLSCPAIVTISGQPALIEVGFNSEAAPNGFRLSANPHLIADSNVIRLNHSVEIGEIKSDSKVASHESLVGSGQTLALLIEQPGKADAIPDRYIVLLTPEHLKEEQVEATEKVEATQPAAALKP